MPRRSRIGDLLLMIHLDEDVWSLGVAGPALDGAMLAEPIRAALERAPRNAFVPRIRDVTCTAPEAEGLAEYLGSVAGLLTSRDGREAASQCLRAQRSVRYALRRAGRIPRVNGLR
jgi:hypothetical protein